MAKRSKKNRKHRRTGHVAPPVREALTPEAVAREVVAAIVDQVGATFEPDPPPNATSIEKRTHPRVSLAVEINFGSESHFFSGLSGDLSQGGVFVQTYRDVPIGSEVELEFSLPNGSVVTRGSVRWHRDASESSPPGVGIAFGDLPEDERELVQAFCRARTPLYYDIDQAS